MSGLQILSCGHAEHWTSEGGSQEASGESSVQDTRQASRWGPALMTCDQNEASLSIGRKKNYLLKEWLTLIYHDFTLVWRRSCASYAGVLHLLRQGTNRVAHMGSSSPLHAHHCRLPFLICAHSPLHTHKETPRQLPCEPPHACTLFTRAPRRCLINTPK